MDAIKFMLILFTTLLFIGWFWTWYTFENSPGDIVYPPYGISRCPDLWVYDPDTKKCNSTNYNKNTGSETIDSSQYITPCQKLEWLQGLSHPLTWDGLYNDGKFNSYFESCCIGDEPDTCGL